MKIATSILSACFLVACASDIPVVPTTAHHPEALVFDPEPELAATEGVDEALRDAALAGKHAMIVLGADWCHDSRALAGWFQTPRFAALLQDNYVIRYIDVGQKDQNIHIAQRFGLDEVLGTPTVFVTDQQGHVLNQETAPTWRNAASRSEDSIYEYFAEFAPQ